MSWQADFLLVRAQRQNAQQRWQQLRNEEAKLLVNNAPCSLCQQTGGGEIGTPCRKNGHGAFTYPHAERVRAAITLVAAEGSKKMGKK